MRQREDVVFTARFEFFSVEKESHPNTDKYFSRMQWIGGHENISWCGIFAGYCISVGLELSPEDLHWKTGVGLQPSPIPINKTAGLPGDIVYFTKNQHYGLIEEPWIVDAQLIGFHTVEGNQPGILRKKRKLESIYSVLSIERYLISNE